MDIEKQLAPFSLIEHDGNISLYLCTSENYRKDLFKTRKKDGFTGTGYDWESLATAFIDEIMPECKSCIKFDPENKMFCAYSEDLEIMKQFAVSFKNACDEDTVIRNIFAKAIPDEAPPKMSIKSILDLLK